MRCSLSFKIVVAVAALAVLFFIAVGPYKTVSASAPMHSIMVTISRNGEELPADQIRSVQYAFDVDTPQSPPKARTGPLRDATTYGPYYLCGHGFSISRTSGIFGSTKVEPNFRSLFVRITFTDGRTVSLRLPILSDKGRHGPIHLDLGDASH